MSLFSLDNTREIPIFSSSKSLFFQYSQMMKHLIYVIASFLFATTFVTANDWYVSPVGNNSAAGTGWDTAYQSIQTAIDQAQTWDIIHIGAGSYMERLRIAKNAITLSGVDKNTVIINATAGAWVYGIELAQTSDVVLKNFSLLNSTHYGIKVAWDFRTLISNINVSLSTRSAFDFNGSQDLTISDISASSSLAWNGVSFTDVKNATISNVVTTGNAWWGIALYTQGTYYSGGTSNITIWWSNILGETVGLYAQVSPSYPLSNIVFNSPAYQYSISRTSASPYYGFINYFTDLLSLESAFVSEPLKSAAIVRKLSDNSLIVLSWMSIQTSINNAIGGDTLLLPAYSFAESLTINKSITIRGVSGTILWSSWTSPLITLQSSWITLESLLLLPVHTQGIVANGVTLDTIVFSGISVRGTNETDNSQSEIGFYLNETATVTNLTVKNSDFSNLTYGWYIAKHGNRWPAGSNLQGVFVGNSSFTNNDVKGLYFEKLSDALFSNVIVSNNGLNTGFWNAKWNGGLELNLKGQEPYANIVLRNMTFMNNGLGVQEGAALIIKARDDGGIYSLTPAQLSGVSVLGGTFAGNERNIILWEPGVTNATPMSVVVSGVQFNGTNTLYVGGLTGSTYGDLVNQTLSSTNANNNRWWTDEGPSLGNRFVGTGNATYWCAVPDCSSVISINYRQVYSGIAAALLQSGISTTLNQITNQNVQAFTGLILQKTGVWRIAFSGVIDMTNANTLALMSQLSSVLTLTGMRIGLDVSSTSLAGVPARLSMYVGGPLVGTGIFTANKIRAKDNSGNVLTGIVNYPSCVSIVMSGVVQSCSFDVAHFTTFTMIPFVVSGTLASNNPIPTLARSGNTITMIFQTLNPVTGTVTFSWVSYGFVQSGVNRYVFTLPVTPLLPQGNNLFTVDLTDTITSATGQDVLSGVIIDSMNPALTGVSMSSNNARLSGWAKSGDVITVNFTASELLTGLQVRIGTGNASVTNSGLNYTATRVVTGIDNPLALPNLSIPLRITYRDLAGNSGTTITGVMIGTAVILDTVAPTQIAISQYYIKSLSNIPMASTATSGDEVWLAPSGTTGFVAWTNMTTFISNGTQAFIVTPTPLPATEGTYRLYQIDPVGNVSVGSPNTVVIDITPPTILSTNIRSNWLNAGWAKVGDTVTLVFTGSESVTPLFTALATVGSTPVGGPVRYQMSYVMKTGDAQWAVPFSIQFQDLATNPGSTITNQTVANNGSVIFDDINPTLTLNSISSNNAISWNYAKIGDTIRLIFTGSEQMSLTGMRVYIQGKTGTVIASWVNRYVVTGTLWTWDVSGLVTYNFANVTDMAGNPATVLTGTSSIIFVNTPPVLSGLTMFSNNVISGAYARSGNLITINFSTLSLLSGLQIRIASGLVSNWTSSVALYTWSLIITGWVDWPIPYRLSFTDFVGNAWNLTGAPMIYDSIVPVITGVIVTGITDTTASVKWFTNEFTTSNVTYGVTTGYGLSSAPWDFVANLTGHDVWLASLATSTVYYFQIMAADLANNIATFVGQFTTLATPPSVPSGWGWWGGGGWTTTPLSTLFTGLTSSSASVGPVGQAVVANLKTIINQLENASQECAFNDFNYASVNFEDIQWLSNQKDIETLLNYCIVKGKNTTTFSPDFLTKRSEFVKVAVKLALSKQKFNFATYYPEIPYDDIIDTGAWYIRYFAKGKELNMLSVIESFSWDQEIIDFDKIITHDEAKAILQRALLIYNPLYTSNVDDLTAGLWNSRTKFLSRSEMATLFVRVFDLKADIGKTMRSNNAAFLKILVRILRTRTAADQTQIISTLIERIGIIDGDVLFKKFKIYKEGLLNVLKSVIQS